MSSSPPTTAPVWSTSPRPTAKTTTGSRSKPVSTNPGRSDAPLYNPVGLDGNFTGQVTGFDGRFVKDAEVTAELIADLDHRGLLFRADDYEHSYPHCWRCSTPLLYYAKASWYIRTSEAREQMLAGNRGDRLAPRAHQGRSFRQVAGEQRRLGAVSRSLLGHASAGLGMRPRRLRRELLRRFGPGAERPRRRRSGRPPPPLHR